MRRSMWGVAGLAALVLGLLGWRRRAERTEASRRLAVLEAGTGRRFEPAELADLPEPARRYLGRAIAPGTPLAGSVELDVGGTFRLAPGRPWRAVASTEVLSLSRGYYWRAHMGSVRGYDLYAKGVAEMRWWLFRWIPIVRVHGRELARSAAGRLAMESVWLPSALLPSAGATWEAIDPRKAAVTLDVDGEKVRLVLHIDKDGRLTRLAGQRWRGDVGASGYQEFGGDTFLEEREFGGYRIPTRFRVGWQLGGKGSFAFFQPVVTSATFR